MEILQAYLVENEFEVDPQKNLLQGNRIEPRLMKLLCLLVQNKGKMVSRESIIETIWNGYGGGEDGLTQAVSYLRKMLGDSEKKIIETIPKQGYVFNGLVTGKNPKHQTSFNHSKNFRINLLVAAGILLVATIITSFLLVTRSDKNEVTNKPVSAAGVHDVNHNQKHPH